MIRSPVQTIIQSAANSPLLAAAAPEAPGGDLSLTWQSDSTVTTTATTMTKASGSNAWDAHAYTDQSLTSGCYFEFKVDAATNQCMVGINTDPATDSSFASIDYAFFTSSVGSLRAYESGSLGASFTTYLATDTLAIEYVGTEVRYYQNGALLRTVTGVSTGLTMYIDSSLNSVGAGYNSIVFRAVK